MLKFFCDGCGKEAEAVESMLMIEAADKALRELTRKEEYNRKVVASIPPPEWRMVESSFYKKVFLACTPGCIAAVENKYPNIKKMRDEAN